MIVSHRRMPKWPLARRHLLGHRSNFPSATVMIADFCGMVPLRDDILLPDNNAIYANNAMAVSWASARFSSGCNILPDNLV